eukprot:5221093-Prorocentrum_lima.AAC.1
MSAPNAMLAFTAPTFCRTWTMMVTYGGTLLERFWAAAITVVWDRVRWRSLRWKAGFGMPKPRLTEKGPVAVSLRLSLIHI